MGKLEKREGADIAGSDDEIRTLAWGNAAGCAIVVAFESSRLELELRNRFLRHGCHFCFSKLKALNLNLNWVWVIRRMKWWQKEGNGAKTKRYYLDTLRGLNGLTNLLRGNETARSRPSGIYYLSCAIYMFLDSQ